MKKSIKIRVCFTENDKGKKTIDVESMKEEFDVKINKLVEETKKS